MLILSQFIDSKGNILKRKDLDICKDQYNLIKNLVYMAQHAGKIKLFYNFIFFVEHLILLKVKVFK